MLLGIVQGGNGYWNRVLTVEIKKVWGDTRNILKVEPKDFWKN